MTSMPPPVDLSKNIHSEHLTRPKRRFWPLYFFIALIALGCWCAWEKTLPSESFKPDTFIDIPEGASLSVIGKILQESAIIRSPLYFSLIVTHSGKERGIAAGKYLFHQPENVFQVAARFVSGDHGIETKKITIPEGLTLSEMSKIFEKELGGFDAETFLSLTEGKEGYLFPDTYFFFSTATSGEVYLALSENFNKKTALLHTASLAEKKDWSNIVIMASIIEGEAVTPEDRRIVSGILYNRLRSGMRLGVDAPFAYIMHKGSLELTQSDLATTSPYNTYRNFGLPPTPINSPGIDAIEAALHPNETPYLYYLSERNGTMHYARTFAEHKLNKDKYLR